MNYAVELDNATLDGFERAAARAEHEGALVRVEPEDIRALVVEVRRLRAEASVLAARLVVARAEVDCGDFDRRQAGYLEGSITGFKDDDDMRNSERLVMAALEDARAMLASLQGVSPVADTLPPPRDTLRTLAPEDT